MQVNFDGPIQIFFSEEDQKRLDNILLRMEEIDEELKHLISSIYEKENSHESEKVAEETKKETEKEPEKADGSATKEGILAACNEIIVNLAGEDKQKKRDLSILLKNIASKISNGETSKPSELRGFDANRFIDEISRITFENGKFNENPF